MARFKKISEHDLRSISYRIHLTETEAETIRTSAGIRNLSVADFMRKAALGRRADVRYETQIVLSLWSVDRSLRALRAAMVERGINPPDSELRPVLKEIFKATAAIADVK